MKTSIMILISSLWTTLMTAQTVTNDLVSYEPKRKTFGKITTVHGEQKGNRSAQLIFIPYRDSVLLAAYPDKGLRRTVKGTIVGNSETLMKPLRMVLTTSKTQTTIIEPYKILFPKNKLDGIPKSIDDYIELELPQCD